MANWSTLTISLSISNPFSGPYWPCAVVFCLTVSGQGAPALQREGVFEMLIVKLQICGQEATWGNRNSTIAVSLAYDATRLHLPNHNRLIII